MQLKVTGTNARIILAKFQGHGVKGHLHIEVLKLPIFLQNR